MKMEGLPIPILEQMCATLRDSLATLIKVHTSFECGEIVGLINAQEFRFTFSLCCFIAKKPPVTVAR